MTQNVVRWQVEGMTCHNCAANVRKYLQKQGIETPKVSLASSEVQFEVPTGIPLDRLSAGIESLGYHIVNDTHRTPFWTLRRKLIFTLFFAVPLLLMHLMHALGVHLPEALINPWTQLAICLPAYAVGFLHFGKSSYNALRNGLIHMDVLIFIGSTAAFVYSLVGTITGNPDYIFYETAATIIALVLFGNYLEKRAVDKTTSSIDDLTRLQVETAKRYTRDGRLESVATSELKVGDFVQINEGDGVPTDAVIMEGELWIDESMLTGESEAVHKEAGDEVVGASIVKSGNARVKVQAVGQKTVLHQIISIVKNAQHEKPQIQRLADKISSIFVPGVLSISVLTFVVSVLVFGIAPQVAVMNAIAVLVISCPCAMGLATPAAVVVGVGHAAKNGILIKGARTLEECNNIRHVVFDKTGTITDKNLEVIIDYAADKAHVDSILYQLEEHSSHPIAESIMKHLSKAEIGQVRLSDIREISGKGMEANDGNGHIYKLGSPEFVGLNESGKVLLTENGQLMARIDLLQHLQAEAKSTIKYLNDTEHTTHLLSGDSEEKTGVIAKQLDFDHHYSEKLPTEKLKILRDLQKEGKTAMVGDGINDAPALAAADIGISLSSASQVAIQSARIVLLGDGLANLAKSFEISKATLTTIKQNLFWAFAYNIVAIPVAAMGFLNPMWGALFMAFSDVVIIANSLRLKTKRF